MVLKDPMQENRKRDHIIMAEEAQHEKGLLDSRFFYEPLLSAHPEILDNSIATTIFGKKLNAPLWVSSMTGGVGEARIINQNLAKVCREFGLGMGLGSCRVLLESDHYFNDFNLRPILGDDLPFFANLGIAQVEKLVLQNKTDLIGAMVEKLSADGLFIHVNPLQEWFQTEGDRLTLSPLETLKRFLAVYKGKVIVKEVGQGMGPESLKALLALPIAGIELAAFGGTNFSKLEMLRGKNTKGSELSNVGHTAEEMVLMLNSLAASDKEIIISGGISDMLDGYYLRSNLKMNSVIGFAKKFLDHAENYNHLQQWTADQIETLKMAQAFLRVRPIMEAPCK